MKVNGTEVMSLATQRSARALTVSSLFVIIAKVYDVPLESLTLLGVAVPLAAITGAIWIVISLQCVSHCVHWYGDTYNFVSWNSSEKAPTDHLFGSTLVSLAEKTLISAESALRPDKIDQMKVGIGNPTAEAVVEQIQFTERSLKKLISGIESQSRFARLYFYGWYLALPLGCGLLALVLPADGFHSPLPPDPITDVVIGP